MSATDWVVDTNSINKLCRLRETTGARVLYFMKHYGILWWGSLAYFWCWRLCWLADRKEGEIVVLFNRLLTSCFYYYSPPLPRLGDTSGRPGEIEAIFFQWRTVSPVLSSLYSCSIREVQVHLLIDALFPMFSYVSRWCYWAEMTKLHTSDRWSVRSVWLQLMI